jgi:hypothetical protein
METHEDDFFEGTGGYQLEPGLLLEVSETGQDIGYRDTRPAPPLLENKYRKQCLEKTYLCLFRIYFCHSTE